MTKMYVYSLDYDGCMAENSIEDIIATNKELIDEMIAHINAGDKVTLCVGSNRQNRGMDVKNSGKGNPSVFSAYPALVNHIKSQIQDNDKKRNIQFDTILTRDTLNDVAPGTHFKNECENILHVRENLAPSLSEFKTLNPPDGAKHGVDESKISILYAQIHHFASLHPSEQIEFTFKDDRANILKNLHTFYSQHPELIPNNVTLNLEQKFSKEFNDTIEKTINAIKGSPEHRNKSDDQIRQFALENKLVPEQFQKLSIEGQGLSIDYDYAATSTAMFVIAYHIATGDTFEGIRSSTDLKDYAKSLGSMRDIHLGYLSKTSEYPEVNQEFFEQFNQFKTAQEAARQSKEELSKRMNVLIDVSKEVQQNTLTSDHEFQAFDGPMKHASYNVANTEYPLCMKDREPYKDREFTDRLKAILGAKKASEWEQQRLIREQEKITAAAKQGIALFNLQETSQQFVEDTLKKLNNEGSEPYQAKMIPFIGRKPGVLTHNLAIIYNSEELTPIGDVFIRDDLTNPNAGPDRVLVQAFKDKAGKYIVMQNIHGQHHSNAQEGEKNLAKAMVLPGEIKTQIEEAIKKDGGALNYTVCLTGDTYRRRPPIDDEFKYIGVNTSTFTGENSTFWDDKHCVDYTDGSLFVEYENGKLTKDKIQIVKSEILDSNGNSIAPLTVSAEFALTNNHFQEFPFASQYTLDNFQNRFNELGFKDCEVTPEKNDFNVCRVKITSEKNISSQLKQMFKYVEEIQTSEGFKYTVYPNAEIAQLKIKKRDYLKKEMHSELMNLVLEGNTDRLGTTIKEWLDCYPDLLKSVLEINVDIKQDIFLNCASLAKFNLGDAWNNNNIKEFPNRPSISAILNYAAYQVGVERFGDLNKYTETQKKQYIQNNIGPSNIYLSEKDNLLVQDLLQNIISNERRRSNDELNALIHFLNALKTPLEPPLRVLEKSPTRRELSDTKLTKGEENYTKAKDHLLKQMDINKQIDDQIIKRIEDKNEHSKQAKINIAIGVAAALVGGAAIAAIIFTAPFSLPAIIGLALIGFAITTAVLATSTRARNFLKEATKSQNEINSLNQFLEQIQQSVNDKKASLFLLEQQVSTINAETKLQMDTIAKEIEAAKLKDALIHEQTNRQKVEEEILANTNMPEETKWFKRTDSLNSKDRDILGAMSNALLEVGDDSKPENVRQQAIVNAIKNLDELPSDIQNHFQDYFYEKEPKWKLILENGIDRVNFKLNENSTKQELQDLNASRKSAANLLFFKPSPVSEQNQQSKKQLQAEKSDSENDNEKTYSPSYS
jgi:hypothetical protein